MRRFRHILIGFGMTVAVSCIINTAGIGGNASGGMVTDPSVGTDKLTHYRADLTINTQGQSEDGTIDQTERYSLEAWPADKAVFVTFDTFDLDGQALAMTLGKVDRAGYALFGGDAGCRVFWDDKNIQVDAASLSPYLYALKSGTPAGEDTVGGISAKTYTVGSDSTGIKNLTASGKVWVAADGGYLLKYHLELSGEALFGPNATGSQTIDYELSEINDGTPVTYPGDCRPVLTDIPATDDARNVERMPGVLRYVSASTVDQVQAVYEKYFNEEAWTKLEDFTLPDGEKYLVFFQETTGREAVLAIQSDGGSTTVMVFVYEPGSAQSSTPSDATPEGSDLPPSARVIMSLSLLFGNTTTPSVLPSFTLAVDEVMPTTTGTAATAVQAQIEGLNVHYVLTSGGETTDAILFEGKEYEVIDGKAQPGSAMLTVTWSLWQLDLLTILSAAGMSDPQAEAGTTWEGRAVDVYSVDNTSLGGEGQDSGFGVLPVSITAIRGTIWVDQKTGALLKADLEFEADVKEAGQTTPTAHGKGELHVTVSQIGKTTVSLPQ